MHIAVIDKTKTPNNFRYGKYFATLGMLISTIYLLLSEFGCSIPGVRSGMSNVMGKGGNDNNNKPDYKNLWAPLLTGIGFTSAKNTASIYWTNPDPTNTKEVTVQLFSSMSPAVSVTSEFPASTGKDGSVKISLSNVSGGVASNTPLFIHIKIKSIYGPEYDKEQTMPAVPIYDFPITGFTFPNSDATINSLPAYYFSNLPAKNVGYTAENQQVQTNWQLVRLDQNNVIMATVATYTTNDNTNNINLNTAFGAGVLGGLVRDGKYGINMIIYQVPGDASKSVTILLPMPLIADAAPTVLYVNPGAVNNGTGTVDHPINNLTTALAAANQLAIALGHQITVQVNGNTTINNDVAIGPNVILQVQNNLTVNGSLSVSGPNSGITLAAGRTLAVSGGLNIGNNSTFTAGAGATINTNDFITGSTTTVTLQNGTTFTIANNYYLGNNTTLTLVGAVNMTASDGASIGRNSIVDLGAGSVVNITRDLDAGNGSAITLRRIGAAVASLTVGGNTLLKDNCSLTQERFTTFSTAKYSTGNTVTTALQGGATLTTNLSILGDNNTVTLANGATHWTSNGDQTIGNNLTMLLGAGAIFDVVGNFKDGQSSAITLNAGATSLNVTGTSEIGVGNTITLNAGTTYRANNRVTLNSTVANPTLITGTGTINLTGSGEIYGSSISNATIQNVSINANNILQPFKFYNSANILLNGLTVLNTGTDAGTPQGQSFLKVDKSTMTVSNGVFTGGIYVEDATTLTLAANDFTVTNVPATGGAIRFGIIVTKNGSNTLLTTNNRLKDLRAGVNPDRLVGILDLSGRTMTNFQTNDFDNLSAFFDFYEDTAGGPVIINNASPLEPGAGSLDDATLVTKGGVGVAAGNNRTPW